VCEENNRCETGTCSPSEEQKASQVSHMRSKLAGAVLAALVVLSIPAAGQFPAESTIPKSKRHPRPLAPAPTTLHLAPLTASPI